MLWARLYFAVQALAGAAWWVGVFTVPAVRTLTLGSLDPVLVAAFDIPLFVIASAIAAMGWRPAAAVATGWTILVALALALYATVTTEAGWGVLVMVAAAGASVLALLLMLFGRIPTEWMTTGPFAFTSATGTRHVSNTVAQLVVFWGFFLVMAPLAIVFLEQRWQLHLTLGWPVAAAGVVILIAASALGLWSAVTMSTVGHGTPLPSAMPTSLVIAGPYRFVRNPMAVAGIVQGVAVGLILSSWLVVTYAIVGSLLWNYAVRPLEEADLEHRFGEDFREYAATVRCWIP
ncbi:isoprenylcysteine carboxylmethyltransferase family protein [Glaciihabitans arcticus]|uniref:Isoprenylcysteine carboxylmethyltransferase family protein n=1 Tax=Glaciihabitans arcticus TaxID=2668039 RepID=A0A4Q9GZU6_9MICO|nr:isoprenylcysteine carboxylmethyltransferase family protein [Glaciihabitans arcticus]TBN58373.1 isoprenylcysteine carboxylmethyltransferase family protein [Glaciihabitans arcticus]